MDEVEHVGSVPDPHGDHVRQKDILMADADHQQTCGQHDYDHAVDDVGDL